MNFQYLTSSFFILVVGIQLALAQNPCDPIAERKAEKAAKACDAKTKKALKQWKNLETAKRDIEAAIAASNLVSLLPYIGCDASDSSRLDIICESDQITIDEAALKKIEIQSKGSSTLAKSRWLNYGQNKDLFVLCSPDYGFVSSKNECIELGNLQPVIEIRRSKGEFYIFGVPLTGR